MFESEFWKKKSLNEMNREEWEALCDHCGRCCLHKLEDEETGDVFYTNIVCHLWDAQRCRCSDYLNRTARVTACVSLTPQLASQLEWLPMSCAYRRLALGLPLETWHPLISGDSNTVKQADITILDKVINENMVAPDDQEDYIVDWIDPLE